MGLFKNNSKPPAECRLVNNCFRLDLPPDWVDQSIYRYAGPIEDGIQHHITVTVENNVTASDVASYAEAQIRALETELQGYHELKRGPLVMASGLQAYELVYKWCPMEDYQAYQRMVWALSSGSGYALTATFSKKTWKMMADQVDRIIRSFVVMGPA
jgi:hypothetical protein